MAVQDLLQSEIDEKRKEIQTDGYTMSIGELVNLYRDEDLDIHPEFQRFFRWSTPQKSRFIESLILGIPIPSIFVHQRHDGVWDVIDGLQRLSTILEFMGLLRDENGAKVEPSTLTETEYLPALAGIRWESDSSNSHALTPGQQRLIKRASIDVKIVRRESDTDTKFDLFRRLNTGGSQLSDQEVRNCLLLMSGAEYYRWLSTLASSDSFQSCLTLSDRARDEQYDVELALRFLILRRTAEDDLRSIGDMSDFLDVRAVKKAKNFSEEYAAEDTLHFDKTFDLISQSLGDDAFKRYDAAREKFMGGFSISAFEVVTSGVSANIDAWLGHPQGERQELLRRRVAGIWSNASYTSNSGSGIRASSRLPKTIPFAREYFTP